MFILYLYLVGVAATVPGSNQVSSEPRVVGAYETLNDCLQARARWNLLDGQTLKCMEEVK